MKLEFQRKIYNAYKENHKNTVQHGSYEYSIAYNATCSIHTWIIRRKRVVKGGEWHWLQPLSEEIKLNEEIREEI